MLHRFYKDSVLNQTYNDNQTVKMNKNKSLPIN